MLDVIGQVLIWCKASLARLCFNPHAQMGMTKVKADRRAPIGNIWSEAQTGNTMGLMVSARQQCAKLMQTHAAKVHISIAGGFS